LANKLACTEIYDRQRRRLLPDPRVWATMFLLFLFVSRVLSLGCSAFVCYCRYQWIFTT